MPSLYRDYRPKSFSEIIGQEHIKRTLKNAIANGSFAHAYLFTGPRGTGKTTTARIVARAINCEHQKKGEPDNSCAICSSFLNGTSLDLLEIDAASHTGVENIREIIERLAFSPAEAKYKVFIIDEVHMLSKGAFNALLKTLEEPPVHAVFILATTEINKVPATIISRTQRFDFTRINNLELLQHLKKVAKDASIKIDDESLGLVVQTAEGSVRDALSILDKLAAFGSVDRQTTELLLGLANASDVRKLLDYIIAKNPAGALDHVRDLFSKGLDPVQFNRNFLEYLRALLTHVLGAQKISSIVDNQLSEDLARHASGISLNRLLFCIRLFLRANKDFESSPSAELPLEAAIVEACMSDVVSGGTGNGSAGSNGQGNGGSGTAKISGSAPAKIQTKSQEKNNTEKFIEKSEEIIEEAAQEVSQEFYQGAPTVLNSDVQIINLQQLTENWPEIMQEIKVQNSPMLALIKSTRIKECFNNHIVLTCEYLFHKESFANKKNMDTFLGVLDKHFNSRFTLEVLVEKTDQQQADTLGTALEILGGEMV
jgi:DNA polymerase-3 subunit gamma/tau